MIKALFIFLFNFSLYALPIANVVSLKGDVQFNKAKISKGFKINKTGIIKTGSKSFVRVTIEKWGNTIVLGPNSKMALDFTEPKIKKKYSLLQGACRWAREKGKGNGKGTIYTKRASFAVRGTDYYLKVDPTLGESEIIVFEGQVEMINEKNSDDKALINKGQWGGIGGRFGNKVTKPIDLPKEVISKFQTYLTIKK